MGKGENNCDKYGPLESSQSVAECDVEPVRRLSVAIIGPDEFLRTSLFAAITACHTTELHEFASYPPTPHDMRNLLSQNHDVVLIEIDSDPEYALNMTRAVCSTTYATVMVYSRSADVVGQDAELLERCTQMGAREFLGLPFATRELKEAMERAAIRHFATAPVPKRGRLLVFLGAKGGSGVTSICCNFAVAISKLSAEESLLIDLDLPFGDVAFHLGVRPTFSTVDALENYTRMDGSFLRNLVAYHPSGLAVLPAPGRVPFHPISKEALDQLLRVARREFENVVVDAGSKHDLVSNSEEYVESSILYMIVQREIAGVRNAARLTSQWAGIAGPKVEVVLNCHHDNDNSVFERELETALGCAVSWRIPGEYKRLCAMQDASSATSGTEASIAPEIDAMARSACGLPALAPQKKSFSVRKWLRR